ncbi:hypothetical protein FOL47_002068 [Perkinsus chesapeaki]|uniref:Choline transporter-like protein n=1 Tax=Perkinsus chesapeaki TaxID=330153 RepID=A0A7J6MHC5_PERCH|nr:hypothetical protein FOL47_002068 [Perkinsus chesapeaki]
MGDQNQVKEFNMTDSDTGKPMQKGGKEDVSNGPVKNRKCTDVLMYILFLAHLALFVVVLGVAIKGNGNPNRLIAGQDWQGNFCGISGQVTDNATTDATMGLQDLSEYNYIYYALNTTPVFETIISAASGDSGGGYDNSLVTDLTSKFNDPTTLFSGSGGNSFISEITKYFVPVCVKQCPDEDTLVDREYFWEGPIDGPTGPTDVATFWRTKIMTLSDSAKQPFTMKALSSEFCPYDSKYCVPLPGVEVGSVLKRYCVPRMQAIGSAVNGVSSFVPDKFSKALGSGFGDVVGDIVTVYPAIIITTLCSIVIGVIYLIFLRMFVGVIVWLSVILFFLILLGGGVFGLLYVNKCVGDSILDTAKDLSSNADALTAGLTGSSECANGFSIADEFQRDVVKYSSYVVLGLAALYLLILLCLCKRIRLGIALNKVAAQFVYNNKLVLIIPVLQTIKCMGWWAVWLVAVCFTISNVPEAKIKTGTYTDYAVAASYEECVEPSQVYVYGRYTDDNGLIQNLYACKEPRYNLDALFAYEFFSLLWVNAFVIAFGQMIIAGAVGVWYFTPNSEKGSLGTKPLRTGIKNAVVYHQGTLAFGSFILAIVQFIKWWLRYLAKQAKLQHNKVMAIVFSILSYCVACFERCIKFLNKNAYIQTALLGTKFCTSAKNAFFLILRNAARIGVLGAIGNAVRLFGYLFIMAATAASGYFITLEMYDGEINSPIVPIAIYVVVGYVVGKLITNVFGLAVDSMLQCFVADEELNKSSGGAQCTPPLLRDFLAKNGKK